MKLLREFAEGSVVLESAGKGKTPYIKGIFMQCEVQNRNGRVYPRGILEKRVADFQKMIGEKRSLGELGHPNTPTVNFDRVSHLITELKMDGNNVVGKAKILEDLPMGKIASTLMTEGCKLGVSSRGLGSLKEQNGVRVVQDDFMLSTVDIVSDPSAPEAFVENLIEGINWTEKDGAWIPQFIENVAKPALANKGLTKKEEVFLRLFEDFLGKF